METTFIRSVLPSKGGRRRHWMTAAIAALMWATAVCGATAPPAITKEYKVKAGCLFNFLQFVDWPAQAFADAHVPIAIGVLGDDEFGPFLDQIVQGETVKNHPLVVHRSHSVDDLKTCHILFVSRSEKARLGQILPPLQGSSILTVGETEGFTQNGGVINFFVEGDKLRFEINMDAANRGKLRISSQLLSLSRIVVTARNREDR
jgi:hypothetical protein